MLKQSLLIVSVISLSLLVSCATVPDVPACTQITLDKGWCTYTISDKEFYWDEQHPFNNKTWWESKPTMVYLPLESWIKIKTYIIYQCKRNNSCDKAVMDWESKLNTIDNRAKKGR